MGVSGKFCAAASLAIRDSKEESDMDHNYSPVLYAPQATRQIDTRVKLGRETVAGVYKRPNGFHTMVRRLIQGVLRKFFYECGCKPLALHKITKFGWAKI